jgi:hypothetical protein
MLRGAMHSNHWLARDGTDQGASPHSIRPRLLVTKSGSMARPKTRLMFFRVLANALQAAGNGGNFYTIITAAIVEMNVARILT